MCEMQTGRMEDGMAARVIVGELGRDRKHANGREKGRKLGSYCIPLTRLYGAVFVRKCSRDMSSTCEVSSGERGRE